jgi:beta-phosphoglucomutase
MISDLIFDFDGTLFDTLEANVVSYSQTFKKLGLEFDTDKYRKAFGLRFHEMIEQLAPGLDKELHTKIKDFKTEFYKKNIDLIVPHYDLLEFIEHSREHYKTALATTASKKNVDNILNHFLPNKNIFHTIITGEDVSKGKPNPQCYLLTFKALGVKASECLIFEDSDVGIQAARASGAKVVRVAM